MRIINRLFVALALVIPMTANANLPKFLLNETPRHVHNNDNAIFKISKEYKETQKRNYDVFSYGLKIDWYDLLKNSNTEWNAESSIMFSSLIPNLTEIELDAASVLTINSVEVNEEDVEFTHEDNLLTFSLPESLATNDEAMIIINYTYKGNANNGFIFVPKSQQGTKNLAYTLSEPRNARNWMPCNDISFDRAYSYVEIKVPAGYTATSNGLLRDSLTVNDTTTFNWESFKFQIPTYLMAVTASEFVTYTDKYEKKDNTILPINYYLWEGLLNNPTNDRTVTAFNLHTNMMAYFSEFLFEYPYEKYGVVCVPNFGGGMEHNTITTVDNYWIYSNEYSGFAHELAHHWLGNYITCADWQDLWINEGGATWLEAKWTEHYYGDKAFQNTLAGMRNGYFDKGGQSLPPIYDLPESALFNYSLTYAKSGWVYQMLHATLGDEQFRSTLKKIFETYPLTSITTQQFRDIVKEMNPDYPLSWDKFFEQWILKPGHPILKLAYSSVKSSDDKTISTCKIIQTQIATDVPEVFEMPVFLEYVKPNGDTLTKVHYMNSREQSFTDTLDFEPIKYSINQYNFLGEILDIADVNFTDPNKSTQIYPNIAESGASIRLLINGEINSDIQYKVFNELGESVNSGNIAVSSAFINGVVDVNLPELSRGMYYVQVRLNNTSEVHKLIIK